MTLHDVIKYGIKRNFAVAFRHDTENGYYCHVYRYCGEKQGTLWVMYVLYLEGYDVKIIEHVIQLPPALAMYYNLLAETRQ